MKLKKKTNDDLQLENLKEGSFHPNGAMASKLDEFTADTNSLVSSNKDSNHIINQKSLKRWR